MSQQNRIAHYLEKGVVGSAFLTLSNSLLPLFISEVPWLISFSTCFCCCASFSTSWTSLFLSESFKAALVFSFAALAFLSQPQSALTISGKAMAAAKHKLNTFFMVDSLRLYTTLIVRNN